MRLLLSSFAVLLPLSFLALHHSNVLSINPRYVVEITVHCIVFPCLLVCIHSFFSSGVVVTIGLHWTITE
ncbi:hypothetical protein V8F20_011909 [Naviculisporaceae sp. PSN 640]